MSERVVAYVALGSNQGRRAELLDQAVARLRATAGIDVIRVSSYHTTDPVGGPSGQEKYLNAVLELRTTLDPLPLLHVLLDIETQLGRVRASTPLEFKS